MAVLVTGSTHASADDIDDTNENNTSMINNNKNENSTNNNNDDNDNNHKNDGNNSSDTSYNSGALIVAADLYARVQSARIACHSDVHDSVCASIDKYDVENNKLWNRYRFPFLVSYLFFISATGKWISFFSSFNIILHQSLSYKLNVDEWSSGDIPINILLRVVMLATFVVAFLVLLGGLDQVAKKLLYHRLLKRGTLHHHKERKTHLARTPQSCLYLFVTPYAMT
jgi:hypothetical protein